MDYKFCTKCGNQLAENAAFCPKCGEKQNNMPTDNAAAQQPADIPAANYPPGSNYQPVQPQEAAANKGGKTGLIVVIIVLAVLLAGALVAVAVALSGNNNQGASGNSQTSSVVTDAPETDAPATDAPKTDAPATDAPATDAPETEPPATEPPATEAPVNTDTMAFTDETTSTLNGTVYSGETFFFGDFDDNYDYIYTIGSIVQNAEGNYGIITGLELNGVAPGLVLDGLNSNIIFDIAYVNGDYVKTVSSKDTPELFDNLRVSVNYNADYTYAWYTVDGTVQTGDPTNETLTFSVSGSAEFVAKNATNDGTCQICGGSGICTICNGRGRISYNTWGQGGDGWVECEGCHGNRLCSACNGTGKS